MMQIFCGVSGPRAEQSMGDFVSRPYVSYQVVE